MEAVDVLCRQRRLKPRMKTALFPPFVWLNRQRIVPARELHLGVVKQVVKRACSAIIAEVREGEALGGWDEMTITLVSDRRMAALHAEFLGDTSPTDVITFQHGEIVLSAETAWREAQSRRLPVPQEIARYAVHGLLHLTGWNDETPEAAKAMHALQEKILRRTCRGLC